MAIEEVIEAAEWLGEISDAARLKRLKDLSEHQRFYVTIWGHYSAGKSMLINNILNKNILPVQSRETTAVLTYIQYGTQEECVLVYEDGSAANHDLSILKDIFQNTSKFEEIGKIDHLEVYIEDDLLRTGLILVDTPGVNTVIQKHQDLAVDAIEQSGRIIYVLGNSPSSVDRQFIKQISECGVQISFVRTKCDRFIGNEEIPEVSLEKEKETIETFLECPVDFIPVSNLADNKWHDNISRVRTMLYKLSGSIIDEMESAIKTRLSVFIDKYLAELTIKSEQLEQIRIDNTEKMDEGICNCEKDIKILESIVADIETKIERRVNEAKIQSQKELDKLITTRINDFAEALSKMEPAANISDEIKSVYDAHLTITIEKIQRLLNDYFEEIIQEETTNLLKSVSDRTICLSVPAYGEVQQENSRILEMYSSRLLELKKEIEKIKEERLLNREELNEAEAGFDDSDCDEALALLNQKLSEIPSGMALRLAENQEVQPSSVFKAIGDAVDIALLLVPGDAIAAGIKGVANTTKIAQILHKMGKAGEVIVKAGNAVGKNAKAIDRVRDTAYAINQVMGKRKYSNQEEKEAAKKIVDKAAQKGQEVFESYKEKKKSGNVLDALAVAYWTEKLGKQFDSEPRMEVDREEEDRRNQLRKQITAQQQQLADERISRKKELGLLQDREAELKLREQEEEIKKQRIEEEIRKQEQYVMRQVRATAFDKFRRDYKNYYGECITSLARDMISQCFQVASQNITMFVAGQGREAIDSIEAKKSQMEEIRSLKNKGNEEIASKIEKCNEIKMKLKVISNENSYVWR